MSTKKLTTSKLGRFTKFGASLLKAGTKYLASKNQDPSVKNSHANDLDGKKLDAAKDIINSMGELKGGLMKIGQMLSITEDMLLPKEITALFKDLQKSSPSMPEKDLHQVFKKSFNKTPIEIFKEFDPEPIAAASIGQVHRAMLPTGENVAVKIQYPNVERAIENDLKNVSQLKKIISLIFPYIPNIETIILEIKRNLLLECDYLNEMQEMIFFKNLLSKEFPQFSIPKPFSQYSNKQILTMELMEGDTFEDTLSYPQEEKNKLGQILFDSYMFTLFKHSKIHTDPQNGNYLFRPGKIILMDFGSTRSFPHEFILDYTRLLISIEKDDFAAFKAIGKKLGISLDSDSDDFLTKQMDLIKGFYKPYQKNGFYPIENINPFNAVGTFLKSIDLEGRSPKEEFLLLDRATLGLFLKLKGWRSKVNWVDSKEKFRSHLIKEI